MICVVRQAPPYHTIDRSSSSLQNYNFGVVLSLCAVCAKTSTCENLICGKRKMKEAQAICQCARRTHSCRTCTKKKKRKKNSFFSCWIGDSPYLDGDDDQRRAQLSMAKAYPIFFFISLFARRIQWISVTAAGTRNRQQLVQIILSFSAKNFFFYVSFDSHTYPWQMRRQLDFSYFAFPTMIPIGVDCRIAAAASTREMDSERMNTPSTCSCYTDLSVFWIWFAIGSGCVRVCECLRLTWGEM